MTINDHKTCPAFDARLPAGRDDNQLQHNDKLLVLYNLRFFYLTLHTPINDHQ
jgi:hypothetical protein